MEVEWDLRRRQRTHTVFAVGDRLVALTGGGRSRLFRENRNGEKMSPLRNERTEMALGFSGSPDERQDQGMRLVRAGAHLWQK
jgi:hypothetical protein